MSLKLVSVILKPVIITNLTDVLERCLKISQKKEILLKPGKCSKVHLTYVMLGRVSPPCVTSESTNQKAPCPAWDGCAFITFALGNPALLESKLESVQQAC